MPKHDNRKPDEHPLKPLPQDPLIATVQKSLGELFGSTIEAMSKDTVLLIKTNQPDTHVGKVIAEFTDTMLVMLAERVRQSLPADAAEALAHEAKDAPSKPQKPEPHKSKSHR